MKPLTVSLIALAAAVGFGCGGNDQPLPSGATATSVESPAAPRAEPNRTAEVPMTTSPAAPIASQPRNWTSPDDVPRITVTEALAAIQSGSAVMIDVRGAESFQSSRIKGALNVNDGPSLASLPFPRDTKLITYCT